MSFSKFATFSNLAILGTARIFRFTASRRINCCCVINSSVCSHCLRFQSKGTVSATGGREQWRIQGGRIGRDHPLFLGRFLFSADLFFFFFAFHPGGRSGRWPVPLPHNVNVNDAKKKSEKKCVGVPLPLSDFFRPRGIWIPGPHFSQILDPPLVR